MNMHAAKTHLSKLALEVESGQEVLIARFGKPIMKLVPIPEEPSGKVIFGLGIEALKDFDWEAIEKEEQLHWKDSRDCSS